MKFLNKLFSKPQPRLHVQLPNKQWIDVSKSQDFYRFTRKDHLQEEVLEIYLMLYKKGPPPNPSAVDLIKLVQKEGEKKELKDLQRIESGKCPFGIYASNIFFSKKDGYIKLWYLSNGRDFIYATYQTTVKPNSQLDGELKFIVLNCTTSD
jgi:hypothetical protein